MISFDNVWLDNNSMQFNMINDFPQVAVKVDGVETPITPSANNTPMQIATVSFGKISSTFLCSWSQVTYNTKEFQTDNSTAYENQLAELLDIKWYRGDQIHVNNSQFIFKQGYIAGNIDEPLTVRFDSGNNPVIGFQYGDIISLEQVITGLISSDDDLMINQHWWSYITTLLSKEIFKENTFDRLHKHILGVFEKNAIDIKG
jgi:hypothetical protein